MFIKLNSKIEMTRPKCTIV